MEVRLLASNVQQRAVVGITDYPIHKVVLFNARFAPVKSFSNCLFYVLGLVCFWGDSRDVHSQITQSHNTLWYKGKLE